MALFLEKADSEGTIATINTHLIDSHGHAVGPTIGLWDQQNGVSGRSYYPLFHNTAHSIELTTEVYVQEWDQTVCIMLEEGAFPGDNICYIDGRMKEFYLIPRKK